MKTLFFLFAASFLSIEFVFIPPRHNIVGNWVADESDGSKNYIDLKSDSTFTSYYHGKLIHYGNYTFNDPVVSIIDKEDGACGDGYWGKYKVTFIGEDSLSLAVTEDSCAGRKRAVDGMNLRRDSK